MEYAAVAKLVSIEKDGNGESWESECRLYEAKLDMPDGTPVKVVLEIGIEDPYIGTDVWVHRVEPVKEDE